MAKHRKSNKRGYQSMFQYGLVVPGIGNHSSKRPREACEDNEGSSLSNALRASALEASKEWLNKQALQKRLLQNMQSVDMVLRRDVPSDGNCFFYCVQDQMQRLGMTNDQQVPTVTELRAEVASFLSKLGENDPLKPHITDDFLTNTKKNGVWADHVVIQAMARTIKRDILLVTSSESRIRNGNVIEKLPSGYEGDPMLLGHIDDRHYWSLEPCAQAMPLKEPCAPSKPPTSIPKLRNGLSGYKSYLETGGPTPRSTLYYQKRKKRKTAADISRPIDNDKVKDGHPGYDHSNDPIYPGARITRKESIVTILNFQMQHPAVNKETLKDILQMLSLHIPADVSVEHAESMYKFCKAKQNCVKGSDMMKYVHHVCPLCFHLFIDDEEKCPTSGCAGTRYKEGTNIPISVFVELDVDKQLQDFFADPSFVEALNYRFQLPDDGNIRDIYNGQLYTQLDPNFTSKKENITLLWHTDGVQVYNNSCTMWPVSAVINELPPWKRFSKQNFLLLGIYYGKQKPADMNVFLTPFVMTMNRLYVEGVKVKLPNGSETQCHVKPIAATMDLPAVAAVKGIHQWNGAFGCGMCELEGEMVQSGKGSCRSYKRPNQKAQQRTKDRMQEHAVEALSRGNKAVVMGVKGISIAFLLKDVDISKHFIVDPMHGTYLGVVKKLIHAWVSDKKMPYTIDKEWVIEVDRRLQLISPPMTMRRYPLSFSDLPNAKASQYRDFLLFYGLHVLYGILPHQYLVHFGLLVRGTFLLSQSKITENDIALASRLLDTFYRFMDTYYGEKHCTLNVHNVGAHTVECIKLVGPLYTHSAFFFESAGGDMGQMVTGPRNPVKQIVDGISRMHEFRKATSVRDDFSEEVKLMLLRDRRKLEPMGDGFSHTTKPKSYTLSKKEELALTEMGAEIMGQAFRVRRVERYKAVFESATTKKKRHQDCFVSYKFHDHVCYGQIETLLRMNNENIALISPFVNSDIPPFPITPNRYFAQIETTREELTGHICAVKFQRSVLHAIPLKHIKRKLVFLSINPESATVIELPSSFEHN